MSYIDTERVQNYLQHTKYDIGAVDSGWENLVKGEVLGKLNKRFVITSWVDEDTTPELVLEIMAMLIAALHLRRVASEEDGLTSYADALERRAHELCDGIVNGDIIISGETSNPDTIIGASASFFPDDSATSLYNQNKNSDGSTSEDNAAPQVFTMGMQF